MSVPEGYRKRAAAGEGAPAWAVLLVLCAIVPAASRATPLWETNIGSALNPAAFMDNGAVNESNGLQTLNLVSGGSQFAFPFEGTTYDSIIVATSGFFWLGASNTAQCCILGDSNFAKQQFEDSPARIVPGWADLLLNLGGAVYFNQISDGNGTRSVLTYLNIPTDLTDPSNPANQVSFQVQIYATGKIVFSYMQFGSASLGTNQATVIGIAGGGGSSPDVVDFTQLPISTSSTSLYDYQSLAGNFNLSGDAFTLTPVGDGWQVEDALPEPSTLFPVAGTFLIFTIIGMRQGRITKY